MNIDIIKEIYIESSIKIIADSKMKEYVKKCTEDKNIDLEQVKKCINNQKEELIENSKYNYIESLIENIADFQIKKIKKTRRSKRKTKRRSSNRI